MSVMCCCECPYTLKHRVKGAGGAKVPSDSVPKLGLMAGDMLVLGENPLLIFTKVQYGVNNKLHLNGLTVRQDFSKLHPIVYRQPFII